MIRSDRRRRAAFTLVELLTVISIILVLAAMLVGVAFSGSQKQIVPNGSSNLVGWLKTAQAYALRDQKPYGLRIRADANGLITAAQYIEQPDDWRGPLGSTVTFSGLTGTETAGAPFTVTGSSGPPAVDFSGGIKSSFAAADDHWAVRAGDFLECDSGRIAVISVVNNNTTTLQCLLPPGDSPVIWSAGSSTGNWRVVRQPRPMIGADLLSLPAGVAINTVANTTFPSPLPAPVSGNIDILFSPTGAVITPGTPGRDIRLWLVDTTQQGFSPSASSFAGSPLIVTVAVRTGLISVQAVSPGANPYLFVQDGKSSGY